MSEAPDTIKDKPILVAKGRLFGNVRTAVHIPDAGTFPKAMRRLCIRAVLENRRVDKRGEVWCIHPPVRWQRAPTHPPLPQRNLEVANIVLGDLPAKG